MTDNNMKEKISALMDGELDMQGMQSPIRDMRTSEEGKECWEHYHLIGDALRNNLPMHVDTSFAARVSQAIADENPPVTTATPFSFESPTQPADQPEPTKRHAVHRPVLGFAMAASVAAVAYLGVGMIAIDEQGFGPSVATVAPTTMLPISKQNVPASGLHTAQGYHWSEAKPAVESRLNSYLQSHQNLAATAAMNNHMLFPSQPLDDKTKEW
ncbi:sigma-E factor negative regulatory protein [Pseudomonadota bacterium]